jgi:uncharacterized RDD family membrane protein YckC
MTLAIAEGAPVAELDRRFYAFAIDRVLAWSVYAGAGALAWWLFFREDNPWPGVSIVVAVVLVVNLLFAVLLGAQGVSAGKSAMGLRVVDPDDGTPIGVGRALLRLFVVGAGTLPMFGLGVATLAWTAVEDRTRERRGWHDHVSRAIVVDVRPKEVAEPEVDNRPRHVVNLTAMRLMAVKPAAPEPPAQRFTPLAPVHTPPPAYRAEPTRGPGSPAPAPTQPVAQPPVAQPPVARPPTSAPLAPPQASPPAAAPARHASPPAATSPATPPATPPVARPATPPASRPGRHAAAAGAAGAWRVSFDSGQSLVVEGLVLVGRQPQGRPGEPVRHVVPLQSDNMSISKTHAQFHLAGDGALVVMDRGSTNGSILIRQGVTRELSPGKPATLLDGDRVLFGDREMTVSREQG